MELPSFLVTAAPYLFGGLAIFIPLFICFMLFSKKGKNKGPELWFGAKVVQDFGEIATNPTTLGNQKLRLLGCSKGDEQFLVIEVRTISGVSVGVNWVKIDDATLSKINSTVTNT